MGYRFLHSFYLHFDLAQGWQVRLYKGRPASLPQEYFPAAWVGSSIASAVDTWMPHLVYPPQWSEVLQLAMMALLHMHAARPELPKPACFGAPFGNAARNAVSKHAKPA